jgi:hypothetical protein
MLNKRDQATVDRLITLVAGGRSPEWLAYVVRTIAEHAHDVEPIKDDREYLPEYIYPH